MATFNSRTLRWSPAWSVDKPFRLTQRICMNPAASQASSILPISA